MDNNETKEEKSAKKLAEQAKKDEAKEKKAALRAEKKEKKAADKAANEAKKAEEKERKEAERLAKKTASSEDKPVKKKKATKNEKVVVKNESKAKVKFGWIWAILTWLALVGCSIYFYYVFQTFEMFPGKWRIYLMLALGALALLTALLVFIPKVMSTGKILTGVLNILLCCALVFASWYLPSVRTKIEILFEKVPTEGELEINFYVLTDAYKKANNIGQEETAEGTTTEGETTTEGNTTESESTEETVVNIADYKDKTFIVQKTMDRDNQDYALLVLKRELMVDEVKLLEVESLWEAADALRSGQGDVLVMNSTYIPILEDVTGYESFSEDVKIAYTVKKKLVVSTDPGAYDMTTQPFSILIAGNDSWEEVYTTGRTDVDMVATVNPTTKQVSFVSFPRDSYMPNPAVANMNDKLTHMGIYGIQNTVDALANYTDIPIGYYVVINFNSLVAIVNAIGGIDVDNPYAFTCDSIDTWRGDIPAGVVHLDGAMALAYVRERHDLQNGDFDRIMHQTLVIKAMLNKMTTPAIITQIDSLLTAMQGLFKTNVSLESIYALCQMQLDDMAVWNIVTYSLSGSTGSNTCAAMGTKTKLSVVYLEENQVEFATSVMNQIINGEIVTQQEMPD